VVDLGNNTVATSGSGIATTGIGGGVKPAKGPKPLKAPKKKR